MAAIFHDTTVEKRIAYNRTTRDYDCYVDGRYVGSRPTYSDGETLCNEVAYDLITSGALYTATQLDGGSAPEAMAADSPIAHDSAPTDPTDALWTPDAVITVEPLYRTPNDDLTKTPTDRLAYLDYCAQAGDDRVTLSCPVDAQESPRVLLFGREEVPLDRVLASIAVLQQLLVDPRVQRQLAGERADAFPPIPTVPAKTDQGLWEAPLGTVDGCAVLGTYEGRELMSTALFFQDMRVAVYDKYLHLGCGSDLGLAGDMHLDEWRTIECLVQHQIVDRLRRHYTHYRTAQGGWVCEGCGQRLAADDETQRCRACRAQARARLAA
jgi:hypothetical protein